MDSKRLRGFPAMFTVVMVLLLSSVLRGSSVRAQGMLGREFVVAPPFCSSERSLVILLLPRHPHPPPHVTITRSGFSTPFGVRQDGARMWITLACHPDWRQPLTLPNAFLLTSSVPTLAYLNLQSDTALLTPVASQGQSFVPLTFLVADLNHTFVSIATAMENVSVEITASPTKDSNSVHLHTPTGYHSLREKFTFILGRGNVITITCSCDLSGLHVLGSRPLSVLSGSYSSGGTMHVLVENVIPVSARGKLHVLPRGSWMNSSFQILVAGEKREEPVQVATSTENRILNLPPSGILAAHVQTDNHVIITSHQPISVAALVTTKDGGRSAVSLTPVEQFRPFELCPRQVHLSEAYVAVTAFYRESKRQNASSDVRNATSTDDVLPLDAGADDVIENALLSVANDTFTDVFSSDTWRVILYNQSFPNEVQTTLISNRARFSFLYHSPTFSEGQPAVFTSASFLADLHRACVPSNSSVTPGDGVDNDCDGLIDEEFDDDDDDDDDDDGLENEDLGRRVSECQGDGGRGRRRRDWMESFQVAGLSPSGLAVLLSVAVALVAIVSFVLANWLVEVARGNASFRPPPRVEPIEE